LATIKAKQASDIPKIKEEYAQMMQKVEIRNPKEVKKIFSFPDSVLESFVRSFLGSGNENGVGLFYGILAGIMFLFMLLPTTNLVNLNVSRIMERSSEIGVRKAFGATSKTIIGQFIIENLFLTLLGGFLGLVLSAIILNMINNSGIIVYADLGLNLRIFGWGMLICLIFGIISGVFPAYKMSRLQAVEALKGGIQ